MGYKVIHYFEDLQDFNYSYKVGDVFPRLGLNVSKARLEELSSFRNKQGKPLIEKVLEKSFIKKTYTKSAINRMPIAELRKLASENKIDGFEDMSGSELKKAIIKVLGV